MWLYFDVLLSCCPLQDPTDRTRQIAIRIKRLPKGTVCFESVLPEKYLGTVEKEPTIYRSPGIQTAWGYLYRRPSILPRSQFGLFVKELKLLRLMLFYRKEQGA